MATTPGESIRSLYDKYPRSNLSAKPLFRSPWDSQSIWHPPKLSESATARGNNTFFRYYHVLRWVCSPLRCWQQSTAVFEVIICIELLPDASTLITLRFVRVLAAWLCVAWLATVSCLQFQTCQAEQILHAQKALSRLCTAFCLCPRCACRRHHLILWQ